MDGRDKREGGQAQLHFGHNIVGGFLSGAIAALVTAPLDLVKTRIQVRPECVSVVSTALQIWRQEGLGVFFRGGIARILCMAPGCALTVAIFDDCKDFLTGQQQQPKP